MAPLLTQSLAALGRAVKAAGTEPADVLRVSCFLSSLAEDAAVRKLVDESYPKAAGNFRAAAARSFPRLAACEAVAKMRSNTGAALRLINFEGSPSAPGVSQVALVASPKVVLSGAQVSFGYEEKDARLAFQRLEKSLEQEGASLHGVAFAHFYPLAPAIAAQVAKIRGEFFDSAQPPPPRSWCSKAFLHECRVCHGRGGGEVSGFSPVGVK
ncbi:MAG: RidA family protein [Ignavibacteriota bacterium]